MEIIKELENKLLGRKEVTAKVNREGATISRATAKTQLAKALKVEEDLIIVKEVRSHYGDANVLVFANIYDSVESLNKNARPHLIKRNTAKVAEKEE